MSPTAFVVFAGLAVSALANPESSGRNDELNVFFDKLNVFLGYFSFDQLSVYNQNFTYGPIKVTVDYLDIGELNTWSQKGDYRQLNGGTFDNGTVECDFDVSFGLDQFYVNFSYYVHNLAPQLPGFRHQGNVSIDLDYFRLLGTLVNYGTPWDCNVRLTGGEAVRNPAFDVKITPENELNNHIAEVLRAVRNTALKLFEKAPFLYAILSKYLSIEEFFSYWACILAFDREI